MVNGTNRQQKAPVVTPCPAAVHYNTELFELIVNGIVVKQLDIRATNQIAILTAFQEEGWPPRIDDPLHPNSGDSKSRLRSTIHCLNGCHHPHLVHFFADGSGKGIRWKLISSPKKRSPTQRLKQRAGRTRSSTDV